MNILLSNINSTNLKSKGESTDAPSNIGAVGGKHSFDSIRQSLSKLEATGAANSGRKPSDSWSISNLTKDKPSGKLAVGKGGGGGGSVGVRAEFGKMHDRSDLGKRLQVMRPEKRKGKWFSLQEMSDRLSKLREAEKEELEKSLGIRHGVVDSLWKLRKDSDQRERQKAQRVTAGVLGSMGAALEEKISGPPKDHLFEKYFHPDNMSSAEKLKFELKKVRDEFKMSASDCGSARVQVAQLTTKIKHLSAVLHKKGKHSTRGLLAMVQRRKKLLKYLRRTDWDSYCLVLSKLGLRDNPDVKA